MKALKKFLFAALAVCTAFACAGMIACSSSDKSEENSGETNENGDETGGNESGSNESGTGETTEAGTYVFEAEYTDLSSISGHTFSGELQGFSVITADEYDAGASNGYFIGYLYEKGNTITFEITSDKAVTDAKLYLRATEEHENNPIDWEMLTVSVNGGDPIQYKTMDFSGANSGFFSSTKVLRAFKDYTIGTISLQEGKNTITFTVNNNTVLQGTAKAIAPIIDCIKIKTDASLTYEKNAQALKHIEKLENQ